MTLNAITRIPSSSPRLPPRSASSFTKLWRNFFPSSPTRCYLLAFGQERVPRWISTRARLRGRSLAPRIPRRRLPKLNVMTETLATAGENPVRASEPDEPPARRRPPQKFFRPDLARNPLKRLISDERIQGIPRHSNPPPAGFSRSYGAPLRRPEEIQIKPAGRAPVWRGSRPPRPVRGPGQFGVRLPHRPGASRRFAERWISL